jgi:hypothetical protein
MNAAGHLSHRGSHVVGAMGRDFRAIMGDDLYARMLLEAVA